MGEELLFKEKGDGGFLVADKPAKFCWHCNSSLAVINAIREDPLLERKPAADLTLTAISFAFSSILQMIFHFKVHRVHFEGLLIDVSKYVSNTIHYIFHAYCKVSFRKK